MVQSEPWYADIVNYLVTGEIPLGWSKHDKDQFFSLVNSSIGMILICSNIVLIRFLGGVSLIMRLEVSFLFVTAKHVGGHFSGKKTAAKVI